MDVITKDASISNTGTDTDFPGTFRVVLSAPTKDRDGETLLAEEWKQPLPDHITFDMDHGMSVASTIGSGVPSIDDQGRLIVDGTYTSLPRGQETRTLVKEGHIKTTSVAFMTTRGEDQKGVTSTVRELLNGAFVAIPSNREALVLESKGLKAGARNSSSDIAHIQAIHDHAAALGASHDAAAAPAKPARGKSFVRKDAPAVDGEPSTEDDTTADPTVLVTDIDSKLDQAEDLLDGFDVTTLPDVIQQVIALALDAGETVDQLMDVVGIPDPDEEADASAGENGAAAAAPSAAAAATRSAAVENADSKAPSADELQKQALLIQSAQFI